MAGLVATALWLRRRDQRAHEQRLAQESAALAVAEDRLVIARELHDAVSGNLGAITVRCAVAQRLETTPDGLRAALDDVETASREATDALRRMLTVLRDEHTSPAPGAVATVLRELWATYRFPKPLSSATSPRAFGSRSARPAAPASPSISTSMLSAQTRTSTKPRR